jgi:dCMP deaminase
VVKRKSWDEYYLGIAKLVATRSTCAKMSVGAVLTKDNRIIGTGYNGVPSGFSHCTDGSCEKYANHCIKAVHAEMNALIHCAKHGVSTDGTTLYTTYFPCLCCALVLINAGVKRIVFEKDYHDNRADQYKIILVAGIVVDKIKIQKTSVF